MKKKSQRNKQLVQIKENISNPDEKNSLRNVHGQFTEEMANIKICLPSLKIKVKMKTK
jgi:hypothetical protein